MWILLANALGTIGFPRRHCEERSDEAIQDAGRMGLSRGDGAQAAGRRLDCFVAALLAMTAKHSPAVSMRIERRFIVRAACHTARRRGHGSTSPDVRIQHMIETANAAKRNHLDAVSNHQFLCIPGRSSEWTGATMAEGPEPSGDPAGSEDSKDDKHAAPSPWPVRVWQRGVALGKDLLAAVGGLLAVVTLCLVTVIVAESLIERAITVQPLSVPKPLSDDGLSTQVVALQLRDEMNNLTDDVRRQRGWTITTQVMDPEEMPDVVVPTVGLSAQSLAGNVRAFFKINNRLVISGEIVSLDNLFYITLRLNGRPVFRSAKGQSRDHLDDMFKEAARAALQVTQPDVGAAVAFDDGDLRMALKLCDQAISKSGHVEAKYAHILKARTLAALGRRDDAINEAHMLFELYPQEPSPHNNFGILLADMGRRDEAVAEFKAAIALAPTYALAHTNLARVYKSMGRDSDAMEEYKTGIALGPTLYATHASMASALRDMGLADKALDEFRIAASFSPDHANPHYWLGTNFHDLGKPDEAIEQYQIAIALDPKYVRAYGALGDVLHDLGRREDAITQYRAAVALDPKFAEGHRGLGIVLAELGQVDEAQEQKKVAAALGSRP